MLPMPPTVLIVTIPYFDIRMIKVVEEEEVVVEDRHHALATKLILI